MLGVLIINPAHHNPYGEYAAIEPPVIAAMYARQLLDCGISVAIHDCQERPLDIKEYNPKQVYIVVSGPNPSASSTPKMAEAIELSKKLKDYPISLAGLHPLALPELSKKETGAIGVLYPVMGKAAWNLLPMHIYRAHNWHCLQDIDNRDHYASVYTSYGCPFSCNFCNVKAQYPEFTLRPVKEVVDEISILATEYGVKNLKLCDELFTVSEKRVRQICEGIKDFNLNIWAYARVGTVNPTMLSDMKGAGISWLSYGFESFSPAVRDQVHKAYKNEGDTIRMTRYAGINIMGNIIFGLEGDTEDTMKYTLDRAMGYLFEYVNFYTAMPYPGSGLWKSGMSTDWTRYNQYSSNPISPPEIVEFRNQAFQTYFTNPDYLNMVGKHFGEKARQHIVKMVGS